MAELLKPEPMQRTLILASKGHQPAVIETLHRLRIAHLVDHQEKGGEFEGFRIGKPLPQAGPASERLVRIRAILRHLGLEGAEPAKPMSVRDVEAKLDASLDAIERDVTRAFGSREELKASLQESRELEAKLRPLAALPLRLDDYRGYDTLTVFVGRADPAFEADLARAAPDALVVKGNEGGLLAVFAPKAQADKASEVLYRHGYAEAEVPAGAGAPDERIRALEQERAQLQRRAEQADADIARLANEHRDLLLAAEEHLSIVVEKAEAPLAFASTEHAFAVDAWVPESQVPRVEMELHKATGGNVYVQLVESGNSHEHANAGHHAHADAAYDASAKADHHAHDHEQPPTKYSNPKATARFQWFTELFATPRYNEIDPTSIFAFFFPLFFGFMVGDLGLGLLIAALGFLLIRKLPKVDGMKQLGTAFVAAGLVAAAFGGLVFKDALGIPLGVTDQMQEELANEGIADPTCNDIYVNVHEPTWGCLLAGNANFHSEPLVGKVSDVGTMLLLSVGAAFIHLALGLLLGLRNEWGHGAKHVGAKIGYLVLLLTFYPAVIALLDADFFARVTGGGELMDAVYVLGAGFVVGGVILGWAEGLPGIFEIPSMLTAIFSYLRLGAVAIAKGAMAIAFNNLTLVAALTGGGLVLVLGLVGFVVAQAALFVLGILSGGIQALRLNFVEFFTKFYKGGGTPYKPFGRERKATIPTSPSTSS